MNDHIEQGGRSPPSPEDRVAYFLTTTSEQQQRGERPTGRRPRPKPQRSIRWLTPPTAEQCFGVARITVGKESADYFIRELVTDFGRGFEVTKLIPNEGAGRTYHVNLDAQTNHHSCECEGFLRWNHCKHIDGLLALFAKNRAAPTTES